MFTGIVEELGTVAWREANEGSQRIRVAARMVVEDMTLGDSIAVSGCCLTVVAFDPEGFEAELTRETLAKTAPRWEPGSRVNLERAMKADGRFGGHMVSGHVEGTGELLGVERNPGATIMTVRAPAPLARYLVPKGSVCVDGVSLTVVDVGGPTGSRRELEPQDFTLWLIPHTLEVTTLGDLKGGDQVNLEPDLVAKYLERLTRMEREERHVSQTL